MDHRLRCVEVPSDLASGTGKVHKGRSFLLVDLDFKLYLYRCQHQRGNRRFNSLPESHRPDNRSREARSCPFSAPLVEAGYVPMTRH